MPSLAPERFAVCVAKCTYCATQWRPCIALDHLGGFACTGVECPRCWGQRGQVSLVVGIETGEEAAKARAESLTAQEH